MNAFNLSDVFSSVDLRTDTGKKNGKNGKKKKKEKKVFHRD